MTEDKAKQEQEAVHTTIVGGRPPGSGKPIGSIPKGMEVLIKKASVDHAFRETLLAERSKAASEIDLKLSPSEAMMINAIPESQLRAIIKKTRVSPARRAAFVGKAAAVMLAALGVDLSGDEVLASQMQGIRPDDPAPPIPPVVREYGDPPVVVFGIRVMEMPRSIPTLLPQEEIDPEIASSSFQLREDQLRMREINIDLALQQLEGERKQKWEKVAGWEKPPRKELTTEHRQMLMYVAQAELFLLNENGETVKTNLTTEQQASLLILLREEFDKQGEDVQEANPDSDANSAQEASAINAPIQAILFGILADAKKDPPSMTPPPIPTIQLSRGIRPDQPRMSIPFPPSSTDTQPDQLKSLDKDAPPKGRFGDGGFGGGPGFGGGLYGGIRVN
jgi:hypothetical protein